MLPCASIVSDIVHSICCTDGKKLFSITCQHHHKPMIVVVARACACQGSWPPLLSRRTCRCSAARTSDASQWPEECLDLALQRTPPGLGAWQVGDAWCQPAATAAAAATHSQALHRSIPHPVPAATSCTYHLPLRWCWQTGAGRLDAGRQGVPAAQCPAGSGLQPCCSLWGCGRTFSGVDLWLLYVVSIRRAVGGGRGHSRARQRAGQRGCCVSSQA